MNEKVVSTSQIYASDILSRSLSHLKIKVNAMVVIVRLRGSGQKECLKSLEVKPVFEPGALSGKGAPSLPRSWLRESVHTSAIREMEAQEKILFLLGLVRCPSRML